MVWSQPEGWCRFDVTLIGKVMVKSIVKVMLKLMVGGRHAKFSHLDDDSSEASDRDRHIELAPQVDLCPIS